MYPLHPFTVHFPIALLLVSGLFTLLAVRRHAGEWERSAYHCLLVGWLASVAATLTGLADIARQLGGADGQRIGELIGWVNAHAFVNLAAVVVYGQALLQHRRNPAILSDAAGRRGYLRLHLIGAALLVVGGWLGGHLVYVLRIGVAQ
jgi:uncharacterized membrane protein